MQSLRQWPVIVRKHPRLRRNSEIRHPAVQPLLSALQDSCYFLVVFHPFLVPRRAKSSSWWSTSPSKFRGNTVHYTVQLTQYYSSFYYCFIDYAFEKQQHQRLVAAILSHSIFTLIISSLSSSSRLVETVHRPNAMELEKDKEYVITQFISVKHQLHLLFLNSFPVIVEWVTTVWKLGCFTHSCTLTATGMFKSSG